MDAPIGKKIGSLMSTAQLTAPPTNGHDSIVDVRLKSLFYGDFKAVRDTNNT